MTSNKLGIFILFLCITSQLVIAAETNTKDDTTTEEPITVPTTKSSSSTSTTTTTTTEAPPTTVAPSTTTIKPTPTPAPKIGEWSFTDVTTNHTCIILQMALQFNLTYIDADDKPQTSLYNLPINDTKVLSGSCKNERNMIVLNWLEPYNKLALEFKLNTTKSEYTIDEFVLNLNISSDKTGFPNAKVNQTLNLANYDELFETPMDMSYHCTKEQKLNLTLPKSITTDVVGVAYLSHLQYEAFHKASNKQFSTAKDCDSIDTPDIVPIAVGCALAGLVVVVLIAYLVGRRRAQARGYLSM